jgi:hypothetical protein
MAAVPPRVSAPADLLDRLSVTAYQLNSASDRLNAALTAIQQRLAGMAVGIERWVPMDDTREYLQDLEETGIQEWEEYHLGYARMGEGWGMMIRHAHFCDSGRLNSDCWEFNDAKPLLRASRELRLQAVRALPALFQGLQEEAENVLSCVADAHQLAFGAGAASSGSKQFVVPCFVSERSLDFAETADDAMGTEVLSLNVMTSGADGGPRKICHLFVEREKLMRVLHAIRPSEGGESRDPTASEIAR